jgi:hypothetical protein
MLVPPRFVSSYKKLTDRTAAFAKATRVLTGHRGWNQR